MHVDLDDTIAFEIQFDEYVANGDQDGTGFGSDVAEHFDPGGKIRRDETRQKSVMIVEQDLTERSRRFGDGPRLNAIYDVALTLRR